MPPVTKLIPASIFLPATALPRCPPTPALTSLFPIPCIPTAHIAALDPEVRDHDPRLALDGGADGLDFYRRLAREAAAFLRPGGRVMVELGDGQETAVAALFEKEKWVVDSVKSDYNRKPRILVARRQE